MELQVGVKVLLENKDHKFLLLRRSQEKYPEVGEKWDIPGGRIDPGSSLFENLVREVQEEIGLKLENPPTLIAAQDILKPDKHVVRLTYRGTIEGMPTLSNEHSEYGWYAVPEMRAMGHLDKYVQELLGSL